MFAVSTSSRPVVPRGAGADQPIAHEVAKHAQGAGWNEAVGKQAVAQRVSEPLGVLHVRLVPGTALIWYALSTTALKPSSEQRVDQFLRASAEPLCR
jgi:hypothetical protein